MLKPSLWKGGKGLKPLITYLLLSIRRQRGVREPEGRGGGRGGFIRVRKGGKSASGVSLGELLFRLLGLR